MEYELVFIGLKWIGMVEILVGEVAMRSQKHVSRSKMTQVSRDKDIHEALDLEASFFHFLPRVLLIYPYDRKV